MLSDYRKIAHVKNMFKQEGKWEKREKDTAVCRELDQLQVNKFLLRGAEEEKVLLRQEMEGVRVLTTPECAIDYYVHLYTVSDRFTNY